jgi:hypothetical protein
MVLKNFILCKTASSISGIPRCRGKYQFASSYQWRASRLAGPSDLWLKIGNPFAVLVPSGSLGPQKGRRPEIYNLCKPWPKGVSYPIWKELELQISRSYNYSRVNGRQQVITGFSVFLVAQRLILVGHDFWLDGQLFYVISRICAFFCDINGNKWPILAVRII